MDKFYSNGKLLITAEYFVLDGALAFALPTKFGQSLMIESNDSGIILWNSYSIENKCWFKVSFKIDNFEVVLGSFIPKDEQKIVVLKDILLKAKKLNPNWLTGLNGCVVKTALTFPNNWGLGTSSTLIHNIALWANVNPFELLELSFGGSGYDIACAKYHVPLLYQRNGVFPNIKTVAFNPIFKERLFFVYQNQKQDSKEGITFYKQKEFDKSKVIEKINNITLQLIQTNQLDCFEKLLKEHEDLVSEVLGIQTVKEKFFRDFKGAVKSLGAWGGDFLLATGDFNYVCEYFNKKGYKTILSYQEMVL